MATASKLLIDQRKGANEEPERSTYRHTCIRAGRPHRIFDVLGCVASNAHTWCSESRLCSLSCGHGPCHTCSMHHLTASRPAMRRAIELNCSRPSPLAFINDDLPRGGLAGLGFALRDVESCDRRSARMYLRNVIRNPPPCPPTARQTCSLLPSCWIRTRSFLFFPKALWPPAPFVMCHPTSGTLVAEQGAILEPLPPQHLP